MLPWATAKAMITAFITKQRTQKKIEDVVAERARNLLKMSNFAEYWKRDFNNGAEEWPP